MSDTPTCQTCGHVLDRHYGGGGSAYPPCQESGCDCTRWRPPGGRAARDDAPAQLVASDGTKACPECMHEPHPAGRCTQCTRLNGKCWAPAPLGPVYALSDSQAVEWERASKPALVSHLIANKGVSFLSGVAGIGKSTLLLDALHAYVSGADYWHGEFPIAEGAELRGAACMIDAENGPDEIGVRAHAWREKNGLSARQLGFEMFNDKLAVVHEPDFLLGGDSETTLVERVRATQDEWVAQGGRPFDIITFDTLGALSVLEDANASAQQHRIMRELWAIWDELGIRVLVACHPSNAGAEALHVDMNAGHKPNITHAILGSSASAQRASHVTVICEDEEHPDRVLLCAVKARSMEHSARVWSLRREDSPTESQNDDGLWLSAPVFVDDFELHAPRPEGPVTKHADVLAFLDGRDWTTVRDITEAGVVGKRTIEEYLKDETWLAKAGIEITRTFVPEGQEKPERAFRLSAREGAAT